MKKLINEPDAIDSEMVSGIAAAHPEYLRRLDDKSVVIRADAPVDGKIAVVSGGGSGHEPAHAGYVGEGMLDGAACGSIFTSPTADEIAEMYKACDSGDGVLAVVKNYQGDVMNFDTAADIAEAQGVTVEQVVVDDDVAVQDSLYTTGRRGVCGTVFVHKAAGAAAARGDDLTDVAAAAEHVVENVGTMGMALTSCVSPEKGSETFDLPEDEMEVGIGNHGEPGVKRTELQSADDIATELTEAVLEDVGIEPNDEVAVIVNGMGATPLSELYVVNRRVQEILDERNVDVWRTWVGEYMTSLDMAGCSVTLLRMDDELRDLLSAPADTPAFKEC